MHEENAKIQTDVWFSYRRVEARRNAGFGVAETEAELKRKAAECGHRWIPGGPPTMNEWEWAGIRCRNDWEVGTGVQVGGEGQMMGLLQGRQG